MERNWLVRNFAFWTIVLMVLGSLGGIASGARQEGGASARATDLEPDNDDPNYAQRLTSGEVVQGSLRIVRNNDFQDFYIINVPFGKVINGSLNVLDYNPAIPWDINFQLIFWYASGTDLYTYAQSWTENPWEAISSLQLYFANGADIWVEVRVNHTQQGTVTSGPGNYTLSVSVEDPLTYSGGAATGTLYSGRYGSVGAHWYKVAAGLPDNKEMWVKLQVPMNADFDIYGYNVVPTRISDPSVGPLWQQNASWKNASLGDLEEIRLGGMDATCVYYIEVRAFDGMGTYSLTVDTSGPSKDGNNAPSKANFVNDNFPHSEFVDQGTDAIDWWQVNLKAGKTLNEAYFILNGAHDNNLFQMFIFDKDLNFKSSKYNTQDGTWPRASQQNPNPVINSISIKSITIGYDGPLFIAIKAVLHWANMQVFTPARGWYKLTFNLPNDVPQVTGSIPDIHMNEDTVHESLVLANYFMDPDGNNLTYSTLGSGYRTHPTVDPQTGLVTFKPEANWTGSEVVPFQVQDDGPGTKSNKTSVRVWVDPINDNPYMLTQFYDITIKEGQVDYTPDLTTIFADIDDSLDNMTYSYRIVASDTKPPGASLTVTYDKEMHRYKLGPASMFFGSFKIQVSCTDGHTGTTPVSGTFTLNILHVNHDPQLKDNVADMDLTIKEGEKDSHLNVGDLFTDPDLEEDYANDALNYSYTGAQRLLVSITPTGSIVFDTGKEEYVPGTTHSEKIKITARDRAQRAVSLNFTIYVDPVNDPPEIQTWQPVDLDKTIREGQRQIFTVTATDVDTEIGTLTYLWYVNGKRDKTAKGASLTFEPDFTMGGEGGEYEVKVDVSDGTTTITKEWTITVEDVNRLPEGRINLPTNLTKYKKGAPVTFQAEGADVDGDAITFIWRDITGAEIGRGSTFTTATLPKGTQVIRLEITDNKGSATYDVTVIIYTPPPPPASGMPGFEGLFLIVALGAAGLLALSRRTGLH